MKTPGFWQHKNWKSTLLLPFTPIYEMVATFARLKAAPVTLPIPVICVGGVTAGGAGKTPVALYLGKRVKTLGVNTFYLTRGYGGSLEGPVRVNPAKHTAAEVGDEALLLAEILPTIKCADRLAGAKLALSQGAEAIIMDDGFQNYSLTKNLNILVVDGRIVFGNDRLIPAGPLRERAKTAISRSHVVIVINRTTRVPPFPKDKPVFSATTLPKDGGRFKGKRIYAFCGLAYPEKFFEMLGTLGVKIVQTRAFPDHHPYTQTELNDMLVESAREKALLVTTAKDLVRVPPKLRDCMVPLEIGLDLDNAAALDNVLRFILGLDMEPLEPQE